MDHLIDVEGVLTPSCSKTHITYCFPLYRKAGELKILFCYDPKVLLDKEKSRELISKGIHQFVEEDQDTDLANWERYLPVQNLLTISVEDGNGFRGCAHRQSSQQELIISEQNSSPGLISGALDKGLWKVTISVHAVVTDRCKYSLKVLEGDE